MSEDNTIDLNLIELTNLAAKLVDQIFIRGPKNKVKPLFKDLKQGQTLELGKVNIQDKINPTLHLTLDYSEFRGPGFNLNQFTNALKGVLTQISAKFNAKADINFMTSEQGSVLVHLPGFTQFGEQINALVMSFDLANARSHITIKLMFVDPDQYLVKEEQAETESPA